MSDENLVRRLRFEIQLKKLQSTLIREAYSVTKVLKETSYESDSNSCFKWNCWFCTCVCFRS